MINFEKRKRKHLRRFKELMNRIPPPPKWLIDTMEAVKKQPAITLEQAKAQCEAHQNYNENWREKLGNSYK